MFNIVSVDLIDKVFRRQLQDKDPINFKSLWQRETRNLKNSRGDEAIESGNWIH